MEYDTHVEQVTVEVTDDDHGNLVAVVNGGNYTTPEFRNTYTTQGTYVVLAAKKAGSALGDRTFTFELLDKTANKTYTTAPAVQG